MTRKIEVIWNQLVESGMEHLVLRQGQRIQADGLAIGTIRGAAYRIHYQITCDGNWNVQEVKIDDLLNGRNISIFRDEQNNWVDGQKRALKALNGCSDIDIMVTPFTNTLPIQRLELKINESKEISVVYAGLPDLKPQKLHQRYTLISQDRDIKFYRYENLSSGFTSDLKVNQEGLVVDYPGIFNMAWMLS